MYVSTPVVTTILFLYLNYHSLYFPYIENLRGEDNLSMKDKMAEIILSPRCPLFGGSTVFVSLQNISLANIYAWVVCDICNG